MFPSPLFDSVVPSAEESRLYILWIPPNSSIRVDFFPLPHAFVDVKPSAMPMHIPSIIDTDSSSINTVCSYSALSLTFINPHPQPHFRMGPTTSPLSPATQNDIFEILQREQDHAMSLLSSSPFLSSLFISYANRAAALELASTAPSPESQEWKVLQTTITTLQEENKQLKSETREMAEKLEAAESSLEAFRSQVSSLKEINATQQDDAKSLWVEVFEAGDKYDRLAEDSNAEKSTLKAQVLDLEVQILSNRGSNSVNNNSHTSRHNDENLRRPSLNSKSRYRNLSVG